MLATGGSRTSSYGYRSVCGCARLAVGESVRRDSCIGADVPCLSTCVYLCETRNRASQCESPPGLSKLGVCNGSQLENSAAHPCRLAWSSPQRSHGPAVGEHRQHRHRASRWSRRGHAILPGRRRRAAYHPRRFVHSFATICSALHQGCLRCAAMLRCCRRRARRAHGSVRSRNAPARAAAAAGTYFRW